MREWSALRIGGALHHADDGAQIGRVIAPERVFQHLTNPEICEVMKLSRNTVKWHLKNIFHKLNVPNRTVAAMVYSE